MKAREIIEAASFGPDEVKALTEAFDATWAQIARTYPNLSEIEDARTKLAVGLIGAAPQIGPNVIALTQAGLRLMTP